MTISLSHYLVLGAILFAISVVGIFLNRKNVIILLMAIELNLLAVNINFIAFSYYLQDVAGQIFVFFILTVAAAESSSRVRRWPKGTILTFVPLFPRDLRPGCYPTALAEDYSLFGYLQAEAAAWRGLHRMLRWNRSQCNTCCRSCPHAFASRRNRGRLGGIGFVRPLGLPV